ncbi:glycerol-3-phosphate 1-O-acyltransferase PlsY [Reyranella sp.]|uniref:glycerol-3-phosphate 1-O-acyltransferase PlsY n=1 Tax=Reyranella sp. TaxID=1929291 RepID=UPI003D0EF92E
MTWYLYFLAVPFVVGYLLGSIPFGLVLTSAAGLGDIRKQGSGNIGATNVLRTGNKTLAAATLLLDALKGFVAVIACGLIGPPCAAAAAVGAVVGHNFPVWLKFKGGKGMATAIGVTLGLSWPAGVIICAAWLAIAAAFRYSSLASLFSILIGALASWFFLPWNGALAVTVVALLVWVRHHQNIDRLLKGTETKIGQRSPSAAA